MRIIAPVAPRIEVRPLRAGDQDRLGRRPGAPNSVYRSLHRPRPERDVEVVRLVDEFEHDERVGFVLRREEGPEGCELGMRELARSAYMYLYSTT
jgi:hypothetical protein